MRPNRVSNAGPLALESDGLRTVPRGPAIEKGRKNERSGVAVTKSVSIHLNEFLMELPWPLMAVQT